MEYKHLNIHKDGIEMQQKKLAMAEWAVMDALWGREPQVLSEIIESIGDKVDWNYQTYASYLNVLCEKGFVGYHKRGRNKFYYPLVEKDACIEAESSSILQKLNRDSAEKLLLCMLKNTQLSEAAQQKMKALIEELNESE
jgi:BlaI family penicillinase repressor